MKRANKNAETKLGLVGHTPDLGLKSRDVTMDVHDLSHDMGQAPIRRSKTSRSKSPAERKASRKKSRSPNSSKLI